MVIRLSYFNVIDVDVIHSVNAKKESVALNAPGLAAKNAEYRTDSTISIAQLLSYVNRYFPDILPMNVLNHFGHTTRPNGKLGKNVKHSRKSNSDNPRTTISTAVKELMN